MVDNIISLYLNLSYYSFRFRLMNISYCSFCRYPSLQVMGFQYSPALSSDAVSTDLIQKIMVEYITFPVLLSNKYFSEVCSLVCFSFQSLLSLLSINPILFWCWRFHYMRILLV